MKRVKIRILAWVLAALMVLVCGCGDTNGGSDRKESVQSGQSTPDSVENNGSQENGSDGQAADGNGSDGQAVDENGSGGQTTDGNGSGGQTADGNGSGGQTMDGNRSDGQTADGNGSGGQTTNGNGGSSQGDSQMPGGAVQGAGQEHASAGNNLDEEKLEKHSAAGWEKLLPEEKDWVRAQGGNSREGTVRYYYDGRTEYAPFDVNYHVFLGRYYDTQVDLQGGRIVLENDLILPGDITILNGTLVTGPGASIYSHGKLNLECEIEINGGTLANYGTLIRWDDLDLHVKAGTGIVNYGDIDRNTDAHLTVYCDGKGTVGIDNRRDYKGPFVKIYATGERTVGFLNHGTFGSPYGQSDMADVEVARDSTGIVNIGTMVGNEFCNAMDSGIFLDNYGDFQGTVEIAGMTGGTAFYNRGTGISKLHVAIEDMKQGCAVYNEGNCDLNCQGTIEGGRAVENYGSLYQQGYLHTSQEKEYSDIMVYNHENGVYACNYSRLYLYRPKNAYGIYNEGTLTNQFPGKNIEKIYPEIYLGFYGKVDDKNGNEVFLDTRAVDSTGLYNAGIGVTENCSLSISLIAEKGSYGMYCKSGSRIRSSGDIMVIGADSTGLYMEAGATFDAAYDGKGESHRLFVSAAELVGLPSHKLVGIENKGSMNCVCLKSVSSDSTGIINDGEMDGLHTIVVHGNNSVGMVNNGYVSGVVLIGGAGSNSVIVENNLSFFGESTDVAYMPLEVSWPMNAPHQDMPEWELFADSRGILNTGDMNFNTLSVEAGSNCQDSKMVVNEGTINAGGLHLTIFSEAKEVVGLRNELTGTIYGSSSTKPGGNISGSIEGSGCTGIVNHGMVDVHSIGLNVMNGAYGIRNYANNITCEKGLEITMKDNSSTGIYNDAFISAEYVILDSWTDSTNGLYRGSGTIKSDRYKESKH